VRSELAFLRFLAGIRALLGALLGILLFADAQSGWNLDLVVLAAYMIWAAVLLRRTIDGWPRAASKLWLWLDAGVLLLVSQRVAESLPLFGVSTVLPVVAMAVLAGALPAMGLAVACAAAMLAMVGSVPSLGTLKSLPVSVPLIVLALGPAAALLARPSRDLRLRLKLVDTLNERSDPRQGLHHHVTVLLEQLAQNFGLNTATISLQGPEPRVFQWKAEGRCVELAGAVADDWRDWLAALPRDLGCLSSKAGSAAPTVAAHDLASGAAAGALDDRARRALEDIHPHALTLPLTTYGQPLGTLCLQRSELAFSGSELRWLHELMREIMPQLERSDLLEQLQRETASRERERIGRDLHDSAVQPYLGLKYGLEALARQAGPANPIIEPIRQLVQMTTDELQTLRDVISGLSRGDDPSRQVGAPLEALQRQAKRFEALYGLKVNIFAPDAARLRGSAAKAVLHMVNEALTNVRRHTAAVGVTVLLDVSVSDVVLRVRNDLGPAKAPVADFLPKSLADRATEFGGSVNIQYQPDFTEVVITLPLLGTIA
jgi:signal transduction histidine kinase